MSKRTNETRIKEILSTSLTSKQIDQFISDVSLWVDENLVGEGISSAMLEVIERYLSCAFIRCRDLGLKSAKFDDIAEQYQVDPDVSDYLLKAAALDPTGKVRQTFLVTKDTKVVSFRTGTTFVDEVDSADV